MKNLTILGSTGSIGRQAVEVALANPEQIKIRVLVARQNVDLLAEQIQLLQPDFAVLSDAEAAGRLSKRCPHTEILSGEEGILAAARYSGSDTVLAAMVGYAGLRPTLAAIACGKDIALANKETLVAAGGIVMASIAEHKVKLTPVDSEHSAIFQCLRGGRTNEVKRLIITASGGPLRGCTLTELASVTPQQCLHHPNWSMGAKITIDSATLANKGLEVIEAHWLFAIPYEKISVLVHPESIVHSLVEFVDGSVYAQLGEPDMRLPIQYALSWPERWPRCYGLLDLAQRGVLSFSEPDYKNFPMLKLALECGRSGGTLPCVYNAANEETVYAFLAGQITYPDIYAITSALTEAHANFMQPDLEMIEATDAETRRLARQYIAHQVSR